MYISGYAYISTGGVKRTALKKQMGFALVSAGLRKIKEGYYWVDHMDADLCHRVIRLAQSVEASFSGQASLKELWISSGHGIHVQIRRFENRKKC